MSSTLPLFSPLHTILPDAKQAPPGVSLPTHGCTRSGCGAESCRQGAAVPLRLTLPATAARWRKPQ